MKITLKTIADKAGVSITTVSRALAGYDDVNEETRQRITAIAEQLGYQPNLAARHLRSKRTNTLGMVVPRTTTHFSDPFFMELLAGVGSYASEQGYDLLLSAQLYGEEELAAYRRMVAGGRVDGMVVARVLRDDPRIRFLQKTFHPFVAFGHSAEAEYSYIDVDGTTGTYQLVQHFAALGHQHFGLIAPPAELAFAAPRINGFRQALADLQLSLDDTAIMSGNLTPEGGYAAANELLQRTVRPTAIIACNDLMALGVMEAVRANNLTVGKDVAVAGFDDIPAASGATPPLTTVRQPIYDIGCQLADMLIDLLRGHSTTQSQIMLQPEVIVRESSGPPRPTHL